MNPAGDSDSNDYCSYKAEVVGPNPTHRTGVQARRAGYGRKRLMSKPAVRAKGTKNHVPSPLRGLWAKKKTNRHQETSRAGTRQRPDAGKEKRWILQKQQE